MYFIHAVTTKTLDFALKWNKINEIEDKGMERRYCIWCLWKLEKRTSNCIITYTFSKYTGDDDISQVFGFWFLFPSCSMNCRVLQNLTHWHQTFHVYKTLVILCGARSWDSRIRMGPFQLNIFYPLKAAKCQGAGWRLQGRSRWFFIRVQIQLVRDEPQSENKAFLLPQRYAVCWEHGGHGGSCWHLCFTFCVYGAHSTWAGRESTSYQTLNTKTTNSVLLVMCTEFHSLVFVTVKLQFILISICGSVL